MTVLNFEGYTVKKMIYERNPAFDSNQSQFKMAPKIDVETSVVNNQIQVALSITVGSKDEPRLPFNIVVIIEGRFDYQPTESQRTTGMTTLVRNNAVAILYPYARALIAQLTTASNEFPGYNLPTINVSQALK